MSKKSVSIKDIAKLAGVSICLLYTSMGCMGNTQGVASLVEGMEVEEVIKRLKGIDCGRCV